MVSKSSFSYCLTLQMLQPTLYSKHTYYIIAYYSLASSIKHSTRTYSQMQRGFSRHSLLRACKIWYLQAFRTARMAPRRSNPPWLPTYPLLDLLGGGRAELFHQGRLQAGGASDVHPRHVAHRGHQVCRGQGPAAQSRCDWLTSWTPGSISTYCLASLTFEDRAHHIEINKLVSK